MGQSLTRLVQEFAEFEGYDFAPNPAQIWSLFRCANSAISEHANSDARTALIVIAFILRNAAERAEGGEVTIDAWHPYVMTIFPQMAKVIDAIGAPVTDEASIRSLTSFLVDLNWSPARKI